MSDCVKYNSKEKYLLKVQFSIQIIRLDALIIQYVFLPFTNQQFFACYKQVVSMASMSRSFGPWCSAATLTSAAVQIIFSEKGTLITPQNRIISSIMIE